MTYFLDLFAGIGGFALGAHWAGLCFDAHYFSEVDPYAIRVYSARFPDAEPLGDIRAIRGSDLPAGDWIIAGGFPCQDISVAGKGAGLAGERSGLWYEYARIIGELRPRYAIMENVGALAFRGLDSVLGSLAALGYDAEWQDIRASDVGAPHRRERLWIVAYPEGSRSGRLAGGDEERLTGPRRGCANVPDAPPIGCGAGRQGRPLGSCAGQAECALGADVSDTLGNGIRHKPRRRDGQDGSDMPEPRDDGAQGALADTEGDIRRTSGHGRRGALNGRGASGRGTQWAIEPDVCGMDDELSQRLDGLDATKPHAIMGNYGKTTDRLPEEELRVLREGTDSQELQWDAGRPCGIHAPKILRPAMHGEGDDSGARDPRGFAVQGAEIKEKKVSGLWGDGSPSNTSYRPESREQFTQEPNDLVLFLSSEMALDSWEEESQAPDCLQNMRRACTEIGYVPETLSEIQEIWRSATDEEKDWLRIRIGTRNPWHAEWPGVPRVARAIPARVDRLKCLGNSIVPQIAELIFAQPAFDEWRRA